MFQVGKSRVNEETSPVIGFDPIRAQGDLRHAPKWIDFKGEPVQAPAVPPMSAETASGGGGVPDMGWLSFRDPEHFVAAQLHKHYSDWDAILPASGEGDMVRAWIAKGVEVTDFLRPFNGKFKGTSYSAPDPLPCHQPNAAVCNKYKQFVSETLEEWVSCGAVKVLGRVGEVDPPLVTMPLTVEPSKPRLCHDERYLNLWVKDLPFTLDTLKDAPRLVGKRTYMSSIDHKSGYQHVRLTKDSEKYFGICWEGFYLVYTTLPFGFKASCYVYNTMSTMVASFGRGLGVPNLVYIDDNMNTEHNTKGEEPEEETIGAHTAGYARAVRAVYIMCELWCRLGYTLSLSKSVLIPTQILRFLGLLIDSVEGAFFLPEDKKVAFAQLREHILSQRMVGVKTMQRLQGKCISFTLAVPAARLYISEMSNAIARAVKK